MREIKFRAWDGHKMQTDFTIDADDGMPRLIGYSIHGAPTDPAPQFKVMQFTGLKDKNEKCIYVGDILKHNGSGDCAINSTPYGGPYNTYKNELVEIIEGAGGYFARHISGNSDSAKHIPNCVINGWQIIQPYELWNHQRWFSVIGNIYENQELLK